MSQATATLRIRGVLNARCLLACLGLTFYWPMFRSPFLGTVLTAPLSAALDTHLFFDAFLLVLGILAVAFVSATGKLASFIEHHRFAGLAFGMMAAAGSAGLLCAHIAPTPGCQAVTLLSTLLLAGGFALISLAWAQLLATLDRDQALVCLHLSFLASFSFGVFDFSPTALKILCLILPLGSSVAASFLHIGHDVEADDFIGDWASSTFDSRHLVFGIVFGMAVGLIACGVLRSLWIGSAISYKPSTGILPTYAISIFIATILLLLLLFIPKRRVSLFTGLALLFATLLAAIALCSLLGPKPALSLTASVRTAFEFYLWGFLMLIGMDEKRFGKGTWGGFFIINPLSLLLTSYALPFVLGIDSHNSVEHAGGLAVLSLFIVAIAFIVIAGSFIWRVEKSWDNEDAGIVSGFEGSSERDPEMLLAERYGLTEREAEIACYIARGHSVKKTAETLCLSQSTVQYHMKSIYRKMGINSKQQLIDEFEALL